MDAATGKKVWSFDPLDGKQGGEVNRGLTYWENGDDKRILMSANNFLFALNAKTGKPISTFGENGKVDLKIGLRDAGKDFYVSSTSPGIIYMNLIIMGCRVPDTYGAQPGFIRAYNCTTGKLVWTFHTVPYPGEPGYETWPPDAYKVVGGVNNWAGMSIDSKRGMVFLGLGSPSYDFYGKDRKGSNLYGNCVLALDAATGKHIWHFQLVHHDLWDKDLPAPPALITVTKDGRQVDAVAQTTKNGMVYVFERETGKPLFDVDEVKMDTTTDLEGEEVWPTQPIPRKPVPFVRQHLTDNDINPYLEDSVKERLTNQLKNFRHDHMYTPPGKIPSIVFPGYDGGGEWGGPAFDPQTGILYVNANEMAWIMEMRENKIEQPKKESWLQAGERLYKQNCSACHGADRKGTGNNPTLVNIQTKYKKDDFLTLVNSGRRMMPAFKHLGDDDKNAIASFILDLKRDQKMEFPLREVKIDSVNFMPYKLTGYTKFLSPDGYPAISPPWGTLNAINLNTGEFVWKTALGEYAELKAKGIPPTGTENYGGPAVTAGGLVFIGASRDGKLRAFNKANGKLIWEYTLPAAAFATPAIYELNGKQYLVIACGGGKLKTKSGDAYVAFALP